MPQEKVLWEVYGRDEDGLDHFLGRTLAVSESKACNNVRMRRWGKSTPHDRVAVALFARVVTPQGGRQLRLSV